MKPQLRAVWTRMRTVSLRGHRGRNVPYDLVCEKQNLESKELVGDNPTNAQLSKLAGLLNASRHIAPRFQKALGVPHGLDSDEGSQYSHQLDGDKQAVRDFLHTKLGDWQQLCGTSSRQRFQAQAGRRVENPSARVARRAGAASTDGLAASEGDESEDDAKGNSDDDDGQDDDDHRRPPSRHQERAACRRGGGKGQGP